MSNFHEGYIMIDHRASPGTKEVPEGTLLEAATMHCAHCGSVVIMNPGRTRDRANCAKCGKYVCDTCAVIMKQPDYIHIPYKKKIENLYEEVNRKVTNG